MLIFMPVYRLKYIRIYSWESWFIFTNILVCIYPRYTCMSRNVSNFIYMCKYIVVYIYIYICIYIYVYVYVYEYIP